MAFPEHTEMGGLEAAMTALTANTANAGAILQQTFTRQAGDAAASWTIAMQSPTFNAASAQRMVTESGSGRTRIESNTPAGTQTVGDGT